MAKIRVYELAKELNIDSKKVIEYLNKNGNPVSSASSGVEENDAAAVRSAFAAKENTTAKATAEPANKPAKRTESASSATEGEKNDRPQEKHKKKRYFVVNHQNMSGASGQGSERRKRADRSRTDNRGRGRDNGDRNKNQTSSRTLIRPRGLVSRRTLNPSPAEEAEAKARRQEEEQRRKEAAAEEARLAAEQAAKAEKDTVEESKPAASTAEKAADKASAKAETSAEKNTPSASKAGTAKKSSESHKESAASEDKNKTRKPAQKKSSGEKEKIGLRIIGHIDTKSSERSSRNAGSRSGNSDRRSSNRNDRRNDRNLENGSSRQGNRSEKRNGNRVVAEAPASDRQRDGRRNEYHNNHRRNERDSRKQENFINLEKAATHKHNKSNKGQERNMDEILTIQLPEHLTIHELADKMKVTPADVIKKLFLQGKMATMNTEVDYEQAEAIAEEFNCICEKEEKVDVIEELLKDDEDDPSTLVPRPPVVCVMGHVDHGKTSLLDAIRHTNVTGGEAGGITQAIGAYTVNVKGRTITFLDTPGHEAFTAMRMRGAQATDIAVLVVAADDGVMPQTVEAINHAKAAGVEIIVAINKIDKPGANIDRVKQELTEYGLVAEDWGGDTTMVPVSAKTKEGLSDLLDMILLTADVMELKANPNRAARGLIIEARLDKGRGVVATALVQKGTLHVGDYVAAGASYGRVRAMTNDKHKRVKSAGPSVPVAILGLSEVPNAGEIINALDSEKEARSYAETFVEESRNKLLDETRARANLNNIFDQIQSGEMKELDVIVKADVQGSVEAVKSSLLKLSNDEVTVKVIHAGVGAINESDVILASASNAIIIGFNVRPDPVAKNTAEDEGVDIRLYTVIYNAIEDVESAMKGMLEPVYEEQVTGHAQVRQLFKASGVGNIAGSYVLDGYIERGCKVRVMRGEDKIYEGDLGSLKRFKDDVKEVKAGYECGIVIDGFNEIAVDDTIEAYKMVEVPRQEKK